MTLKMAIQELERHGYRVCSLQMRLTHVFKEHLRDFVECEVHEWVPTEVPLCPSCGSVYIEVDCGDGWPRCSCCGMN